MKKRKSHWDAVYKNKAVTEVSWYQAMPEPSLTLIRHTEIQTNEWIIDVGGGASLLVDALLAEQYTSIAVLDIASGALGAAQERLGEKAQSVEWYEADITEFNAPHRFSIWHDRAVFHFLTEPEDRRRYVATIKQTLLPRGHLIMAAFAIGGPERCSGLDIVQYDAEKLMLELGEQFSLQEEIAEIHVTPAGKEQQFNYYRLQYI